MYLVCKHMHYVIHSIFKLPKFHNNYCYLWWRYHTSNKFGNVNLDNKFTFPCIYHSVSKSFIICNRNYTNIYCNSY